MIYNTNMDRDKYSFSEIAKKPLVYLFICSCVLLSSCSYFESEQTKLQKAQNYYKENKFNLAVIQTKHILQSDAKNCEARILLGKSLFAKFSLVGAGDSLKAAKREGCKDSDMYTYLTKVFIYRNQFANAESLMSDPDYLSVVKQEKKQLLEGDLYFFQNNYDKAESAYAKYYELSHDAASNCLAMAKLSAMKNNYQDVIEKTLACESKFSNQNTYDLDQSRYLRAVAQVKEKHVQKAMGTLNEILGKYQNPKDSNIKIESSLLLMDLYLNSKDVDSAAKMADAVLKYVALPRVYYVKGLKYEKDNRDDLAEQQFLKALKLNPNFKPSLFELANIKFKEGNVEQAQYYTGKIDALTGTNTFTEQLDESLAAKYYQRGDLDSIINKLPHNKSGSSLKSQYILALAYAKKGEKEKALQVFQGIEQGLTDNTKKELLEARLDVALRDYGKAENIFGKYAKNGNTYAVTGLTLLYIQEHKFTQAEGLLLGVRNKNPNNPEFNLLLAEVYSVTNQKQKLFELLDGAIKASPNDLQYKLALAKTYYKYSQYQKTISLCDLILKANPAVMPAYVLKANSYIRLGQINLAENSYNDLLKQNPRSDYAYLMLSYLAAKGQNYKGALSYIDKALEINPRNMQAVYAKINYLVELNKKDDALTFARSTSNILDEKQSRKVLLGYAYERIGDDKNAYLNYKDALANGNHEVRVALQVYLLSKKVNGDAVADKELSGFIQKNNELNNTFVVANFFMRLTNYQQASKYYEAFIKRDQSNPVVYNNLAWLTLHAGDTGGALNYANKALSLAPNSAAIMDTMGQVLLRKGDYNKAGTYLQNAHKLLGDDPSIKYHLAEFYYYTNNFEKSKSLLQQVVDAKFAEQDDAKKLLKKINQ